MSERLTFCGLNKAPVNSDTNVLLFEALQRTEVIVFLRIKLDLTSDWACKGRLPHHLHGTALQVCSHCLFVYGLVKTTMIIGDNIHLLSDSGRRLAIVGFARAVPHL